MLLRRGVEDAEPVASLLRRGARDLGGFVVKVTAG
jgi:hypothetical protein